MTFTRGGDSPPPVPLDVPHTSSWALRRQRRCAVDLSGRASYDPKHQHRCAKSNWAQRCSPRPWASGRSRAGGVRAEQGRRRQGGAGQGASGWSRAGGVRVEQGRERQGGAGQGASGWSRAGGARVQSRHPPPEPPRCHVKTRMRRRRRLKTIFCSHRVQAQCS